MNCNLCGSKKFVDMKSRPNVRCSKCGSLERTRLLWLYLQNIRLDAESRVLHLAPERGLFDALSRRLKAENYVVADIDPERYAFARTCRRIDLCDLDDWPSCEFDLIVHSHVLEHSPCNIAYTLFHLHRMLKDDGLHVFVVPFMRGKYDESFQDLSDEERHVRFGQFDHVRRFGNDDIASHLGKIVNVPARFDPVEQFGMEVLRQANIPDNHWRGFHIGTVLMLRKDHYRLR